MRGGELQQTCQLPYRVGQSGKLVVGHIELFQFSKFSQLVWQLRQLVVVQFQRGEGEERAEGGREGGKVVATVCVCV